MLEQDTTMEQNLDLEKNQLPDLHENVKEI